MQDQASNLKSSDIVAVISGKGGVGKTLVATNLAAVIAENGKKVLLLDADVGFTNADILLGVYPKHSIKDFVNHKCDVQELITPTSYGVDLISLGGDVSDLLAMNEFVIKDFATSFLKLLENYDIVFMDMPPGFSNSYMPFLALVDKFIVLTTPEPTSVVNTYTMVKLLSIKGIKGEDIHIVANMVQNTKEAESLMERFSEVVEKFIGNKVSSVTMIKEHPLVVKSIHDRQLFALKYRSIQPSFSIMRIASYLLRSEVKKIQEDTLIQKFLRFFRGDNK
ncbi:P-loop NTPase [Fervidobacterium pennivorans subsp. shakshaketiis]|jgi:flagellar biosynthesis protein FlhG|uniref:ATPase involved in chromosome partitioning n=1 Tax=Fervidobacterium pennivorans (strain DSM 9078 / Ven5) TaxID=771875 RepID=H9U9Y5_FERPD|nr:P-loop NTPase [Fervidobacterium pennivorans]AFG34328.1 ATPase involved in chromosome partitioning [Fervidobacterium pennivorans DSM 9078]QIV77689.1 MinD/ParA family protein [Fervidobacterium pennivorans subsp. keratinolyticus]